MIGVFLFHVNEFGINPKVKNLFDSLWWGLSTVTTVGYGDIIPVTLYGKFAGIFLMLTGLLLFISFSALFVSIYFTYIETDLQKSQKITYKEFELIMIELNKLQSDMAKLTDKKTSTKSHFK